MLDPLIIQRMIPPPSRKASKVPPSPAKYRDWLTKAEARLAGLLRRQEAIQHHLTHWTRKQNSVALSLAKTTKRVTYLRKHLTGMRSV